MLNYKLITLNSVGFQTSDKSLFIITYCLITMLFKIICLDGSYLLNLFTLTLSLMSLVLSCLMSMFI